jgi:hypothetical protein
MSYIERPGRESKACNMPSTISTPRLQQELSLETLLVSAPDGSEMLASHARAFWDPCVCSVSGAGAGQ